MILTQGKLKSLGLLAAGVLLLAGLVVSLHHRPISSQALIPVNPAEGYVSDTNSSLQNTTAIQGNSAASIISPATDLHATFQAQAFIQAGDKQYTLKSDSTGSFLPVSLAPHQEVHIALQYPHGEENQPVILETEDGGLIEGKVPSKVISLDAQGGLSFNFNAGSAVGQNRIVLRSGSTQAVLHFTVQTASSN